MAFAMENNENSYTSQLRQPSRVMSSTGLTEQSASVNNARQPSMLPPPGHLKAHMKRKAEPGSDPSRPAPGPPNSRPINTHIKGSSLSGLARQNSLSLSRSSSSASFRNASLSSLSTNTISTNTSQGIRPPSVQPFRPHTTQSIHPAQKSRANTGRPANSLDVHNVSMNGTHASGNSLSTTSFSTNPKRYLPRHSYCNSPRGSYDNQMNYTSDWSSPTPKSLRQISLSTKMSNLTLNSENGFPLPTKDPLPQPSPSQIPIPTPQTPSSSRTPSPSKSRRKTGIIETYLTKDSNTKTIVFDPKARIENMENMYLEMKEKMDTTTVESSNLKQIIPIYIAKIGELEALRTQLTDNNRVLQLDIDAAKSRLSSSSLALEEAKRRHDNEVDDLRRQSRRDLEEAQYRSETERHRLDRQHQDEIVDLKRRLEGMMEEERTRRKKEIQALSSESTMVQHEIEEKLSAKEKALNATQAKLEQLNSDLLRSHNLTHELRTKSSEADRIAITLQASNRSLQARVDFLESDSKSQVQAFVDLEQKTRDAEKRTAELEDRLRVEESIKRDLRNQVQELKGNIRVYNRVRPPLESDSSDELAKIAFPDEADGSKELQVLGPDEKSSLGTITTKTHPFTFDRVFQPGVQNEEVFQEISQLVQSALDGYNVCIFCYGQTGAGKTYTMSSKDGMIPRAVHQIYDTAKDLEARGWKYSMEGSFVEVYNENINDLLGKVEDFDKNKHKIREVPQKNKIIITDVTTVNLDSPNEVDKALQTASANRSVAATQANGRSSRSHSVFIMTLAGENHITGEKCESTLNLVDLAGSERLSHSQSTGDRLKETQNINKSLTYLGDVISALHANEPPPYRNSKLTHLLRYSLGGNSKTLMFVMISPLKAHLKETITSLKFAAKVHKTHIGTAKRQSKIRDG